MAVQVFSSQVTLEKEISTATLEFSVEQHFPFTMIVWVHVLINPNGFERDLLNDSVYHFQTTLWIFFHSVTFYFITFPTPQKVVEEFVNIFDKLLTGWKRG